MTYPAERELWVWRFLRRAAASRNDLSRGAGIVGNAIVPSK